MAYFILAARPGPARPGPARPGPAWRAGPAGALIPIHGPLPYASPGRQGYQ